jgi:hypothetical protein
MFHVSRHEARGHVKHYEAVNRRAGKRLSGLRDVGYFLKVDSLEGITRSPTRPLTKSPVRRRTNERGESKARRESGPVFGALHQTSLALRVQVFQQSRATIR